MFADISIMLLILKLVNVVGIILETCGFKVSIVRVLFILKIEGLKERGIEYKETISW